MKLAKLSVLSNPPERRRRYLLFTLIRCGGKCTKSAVQVTRLRPRAEKTQSMQSAKLWVRSAARPEYLTDAPIHRGGIRTKSVVLVRNFRRRMKKAKPMKFTKLQAPVGPPGKK